MSKKLEKREKLGLKMLEKREESMFYNKITKQLTTNLYIFKQKATSCLHSQ